MNYHLHVIKADLREDFWKWKADMRADWEILKIELIADVANFVARYEAFKARIEFDIVRGLEGAVVLAEIAAWELRFHIAYIWESL